MEKNLLPANDQGINTYTRLPIEGWTADQVKAELRGLSEMKHTKWEDGYVSGAVYHGGQDMLKMQAVAFQKFAVSNPIHPDVFPGVRKMEAEVVLHSKYVWTTYLTSHLLNQFIKRKRIHN